MKGLLWDALLFLLASPILAVMALVRAADYGRRLRQAMARTLVCRTCGDAIVLVGLWRCGCGYTYRGHLLRYCPVCGSFPRLIRCHRCGTTEALP